MGVTLIYQEGFSGVKSFGEGNLPNNTEDIIALMKRTAVVKRGNNNMDQTAVVRKICAALALADRAGTESEAATALATAHRLMAAHNLSMDDLHEEAGKWVLFSVVEEPSRSIEFQFLATVLRRFFLVEVLENEHQGQYRFLLFGTRPNVEIGTHMCLFLRRVYLNLWAEHRVFWQQLENRHYDTSDQMSYFIGLTDGLVRRLADSLQSLGVSGAALVRVGDEAQQEARRRYQPKENEGEETIDLNRSYLSLSAGLTDSERIEINKPIGDGVINAPSRWLDKSAPSIAEHNVSSNKGKAVATLLSELEDENECRWRVIRDESAVVRPLRFSGKCWEPVASEEELPAVVRATLEGVRGVSAASKGIQ